MTIDEFNKAALAVVAVVGSITGPLVAWLVSHNQTRTQRDIAMRAVVENLSAKRQAWIDGLRTDLGELLSLTMILASLRRSRSEARGRNEKLDNDAEMMAAFERAEAALARIELRLNPHEEKHQLLLTSLRALDETSKAFFHSDSSASFGLLAKLELDRKGAVSQAQAILKEEWNRIREGRV